MKPGVFLLGLAAVTGQLVPGKDPSAPFISVAGVALPGPTEKSAILPGIMHGSVQIGQYHPGIPAFYPVNYKPHYQSGEFLAHCLLALSLWRYRQDYVSSHCIAAVSRAALPAILCALVNNHAPRRNVNDPAFPRPLRSV